MPVAGIGRDVGGEDRAEGRVDRPPAREAAPVRPAWHTAQSPAAATSRPRAIVAAE